MTRLLAVTLVPFAIGCATLPHPGPSVSHRTPPVTVRVDAGKVWTSRYASTEPHVAWQAPANGAVDELDVQPAGNGYQVTLRQGGKRWKGQLDSHRHPVGPLTALPELPPPATPALATANDP